ncbi:MAG: alkaline phosphatase family protein [Thaumarchaeota archaeon]|nr:alkaline phosphatase family protein [Nitrososphaerota archaeon]
MTKILTTTIVGLLITSMMFSGSMWAWADDDDRAKTPIKNVVVIFQENISFDHYFGTYPNAAGFTAKAGTPIPNNYISNPTLLTNNPNKASNGTVFNPFLLTASQAITCDFDHVYLDEQKAFDGGLMDKFVQFTGKTGTNCKPDGSTVMGYYDGTVVTGLWNIAQNFAMSDNSYSTMFGPSTPGAINLVSGQTYGASEDAVGAGSAISDTDPRYDDCSSTAFPTIAMSGKNIGDLLNDKGVTWGWFQGGFAPTGTSTSGKAICGATTHRTQTDNAAVPAYSAHHEPFEYYASTANPHHLPPANTAEMGHNGQANHQYDLKLFWAAVRNGTLPQVTYLKAPRAQDAHPGNSSPLDEQLFIANVTNTLENSPYWSNTAEIILYDDSDGWYDHQVSPIVNHSNDPLNDAAICSGQNGDKKADLGGAADRCGYGPRQPFLVVSPYAKSNFISHKVTDQSSVLKFIEDTFKTGEIPDTLGMKSFDERAGDIKDMFDFDNHGNTPKVCLNAAGQIVPPVVGMCPIVNS